MTTPAKKTSAPAKTAPAAPAKSTVPAAPTFSFSNLSAEVDKAPQRTVPSAEVPENILADLRSSWAAKVPLGAAKDRFRGEGRSYTLLNEELATTVANLVRRGAGMLTDENGKSLGASIRVEPIKVNGTELWKVRFCAKTPVARTKKAAATDVAK